MEQLLSNINKLSEIARDSDYEQIESINSALESIIQRQTSEIIERANEYYPLGGYIKISNCQTTWLEDNIITFQAIGKKVHILKYQCKNKLYRKLYEGHWKVNGKGTTKERHFVSEPWQTEEQVLLAINISLRD